ncbi:hypothetical protein P153DRAFT_282493 [Dothidotthia symphoricarpi CBS 119687]|uniref:Uncharacterized protein n=1 Tax=Dothidotthia symphoricarpi CBS 119687 TaxID=1392245 RepID=A0A6A6AQ14_9PLEO|nr:uncharacterized protein P153DRAFT_282493 [Dothidotthia symphoricarpi CBS 119687]KAF2133293.1 hypothetical protein P153DRAFT_282493 [Dothidotthia symphoricarpi CBS 119687]
MELVDDTTLDQAEKILDVGGSQSVAELQRLSQEQIQLILQYWETLNQLLQRLEDTIRKRWMKKTVQQRREFLLAVDPSIPKDHRPDIDLKHELANMHNSRASMLPHINLEDLLRRPEVFLTFLNSRGRIHPARFAHTELVNSPCYKLPDESLWEKIRTHTMAFDYPTKDQPYGAMRYWEDSAKARHFVNTGKGMHPTHGVQVTDIQLGTYRFLLSCCFNLLRDFASENTNITQLSIKPEPPAISENDANYQTLGEAALLAPYRVPSQLDFGRLRSLIIARVGDLADHVWAMREDPGYFAAFFYDHKDHRPEYVTSITGQQHDVVKQHPHVMYGYILRNMIVDSYFLLYQWHECLRLVNTLDDTAKLSAYEFSTKDPLPEKYYVNFLKLWQILFSIHTDTHGCFRQRIPASPPLRRFFTKMYANKTTHESRFAINKKEAAKDPLTKQFLDVLLEIWLPHKPPLHLGFDVALDKLDRLVSSKSSIKPLISSFVWADFSQLSTSSECIHQIRSYQPWATQMLQDMGRRDPRNVGDREIEMATYYLSFTNKWHRVTSITRFDDVEMIQLGDPSDNKFAYPVTERRNAENTKALHSAEKNLDAFWKAADTYCKQLIGSTLPSLLDRDITRGRSLRRTPAWIETPAVGSTIKKPSLLSPQYIYQPFSVLDHDPASEISGTFKKFPEQAKTKVKTRSNAQWSVTASEDTTDTKNQLSSGPSPKFAVNKRVLKVFRMLFYSPFSTDTPGEVPWAEFLHAMASTGFSIEKLHGSAWKFTPKDLAVERSIQFHEPHPVSKLPFTWARRYGRRLERAYGWTGETFSLA